MNEQIIRQLQHTTEEEKDRLREKFRQEGETVIDAGTFLNGRQLISVRLQQAHGPTPPHRHNYIEIMYGYAGTTVHEIEGEEIQIQRGDLLMMNQYVEHSVKETGESDKAVVFVVRPEFFDIPFQMLQENNKIKDFLVNSLRQNNPAPQYLLFRPNGQKDIEALMDSLITSIIQDKGNGSIISQYTMGLVFLHLLGQNNSLVMDSARNYRDIMIQETLRYIDTQYKTASLSRIAEEFHQPLSGLSKLIKQGTGFTFQELLMRKRFQKAIKYLMETDLQVEEIAVSIGYENVSYFYRQFKKRYGMTPRQYRMVHRYRMRSGRNIGGTD